LKIIVLLQSTFFRIEKGEKENKNHNKVDTLSYKTVSANKATVHKEWVLVDANDEILGRLASKVAYMLRGKHKTNFTPHVDCGDNVIVINAEKIRLSGKKMTDREIYRHTGHPGGQRIESPASMLTKKPTSVVEHAVKGMLPKSRLGSDLFRNLYVYAGESHPHEAQQPKSVKLTDIIA
jgi:large subunit ribosomal protein L13